MRHESFGFSLLEVCFSLFFSAILTTLALRLLVSCQFAEHRITGAAETDAMWRNLCRVVSQDVHSAIQVSQVSNDLNITWSSGVVARYVVNANHEFVRIQLGGGTSVVALGILTVYPVVSTDGVVILTVNFVDGTTRAMVISSLKTLE